MKTPQQIRNEEPTGYRRGFIDGHKEAEKSIKEMIEDEFKQFLGTQSGNIKNTNVYLFRNKILSKIGDDSEVKK